VVLERPMAPALAPVRLVPVSTGAAVSADPRVRAGRSPASAAVALPAVRPVPIPDPAPTPATRPDGPSRRDPRPRRRPGGSAARRPPAGVVDVRPAVPVGCPVPVDTDPGYRMSRWARLGMTLTVTAAIVVAAVILIGRGGSGRTQFVTVEPGDTLWSVASRTAPDRDPSDVVAELIRLNGLSSGAVHAGEVLRINAG
jgi:hypothetical protein